MSLPPPPGIYVPAVLFFDENENFDVPAVKAHVLRLAKPSPSLVRSLDENGFQSVVIIAGCGAQSARESKKLCSDAKEVGADYVLVLTPSVWPGQMTNDAILAFHRDVATHSPLPYLVYNFPTVTAGLNLDSDIILELIGKLHRLTSVKPTSEFATLAGVSEVLLQGLLSGSAGAIAALPNIVPKLHMKLYQLYLSGNIEDAMKLQALLGQGDFATKKVGGIGGIKALVAKHWGYGKPLVRSPLQVATAQQLRGPYLEKLEELIAMEKAL
ncbi:hypothetical protein J3R82DRAFT_11704 [Butyriboletus roseoflavus]|nr:hypothetical protein J3R82DRAFT_11704 [Butyriboletus roseoflavus]